MAREIGITSFTYRDRDLRDVLQEIKAIGASAVDLWPKHLPPDTGPDEAASVRSYFHSHGIRFCGYGVVKVNADTDFGGAFRFAKKLGVDYVTINVHPDDQDSQRRAAQLAEALDLELALHNHGPNHAYSVPQDVGRVIEQWPRQFGACVDTGHFLRSNVDPVNAIEYLSPKVHAVHIKDFVDRDTEVPPGTGRLNLRNVVRALADARFSSALVIEYEADNGDPTPVLKEVVDKLRPLVDQIFSRLGDA